MCLFSATVCRLIGKRDFLVAPKRYSFCHISGRHRFLELILTLSRFNKCINIAHFRTFSWCTFLLEWKRWPLFFQHNACGNGMCGEWMEIETDTEEVPWTPFIFHPFLPPVRCGNFISNSWERITASYWPTNFSDINTRTAPQMRLLSARCNCLVRPHV